jgi:diacylglycerol kinase (ATP)
MMQSKDNSSIRFAMIPAGTGNSQAHDFGIKSTEDAVSRIVNGSTQCIDLARVELTEGLPGKTKGQMTRYSHNLVTWGLGVDSTIKAEKMRWMGSIRYDVGILMAIMANNRRHASLFLDGHKMEDDFTLFLIQNSQTGGSLLPLAPGASLDDGLMDIGILKKMTRRDILKAFGLLKKEGRHVFHPRVDYHQFKELRIETPEPTAINIDGENIGSTPLSMVVLPSEVQIFH